MQCRYTPSRKRPATSTSGWRLRPTMPGTSTKFPGKSSATEMLDIAQLEAAGLLDDVEDERTRHERVELLQQLVRDGFALEELQQAARQDRLALLPVERALHREG